MKCSLLVDLMLGEYRCSGATTVTVPTGNQFCSVCRWHPTDFKERYHKSILYTSFIFVYGPVCSVEIRSLLWEPTVRNNWRELSFRNADTTTSSRLWKPNSCFRRAGDGSSQKGIIRHTGFCKFEDCSGNSYELGEPLLFLDRYCLVRL